MVNTLEAVFEKKAIINKLPEQMGDVSITYADISKAQRLLNYNPQTPFNIGVSNFKDWLLEQKK